MPCSGCRGSPGASEESPSEPRYSAISPSVGDGAVVGRPAGGSRAHRVYGRLRQVLRCSHSIVQPQTAPSQVYNDLYNIGMIIIIMY